MEAKITLVLRWGCDGSSGHSEYKQVYPDDMFSDGSLFLSCLVPLRIQDSDDSRNVYWNNPKSSSTRYCRPIRFELIQESEEVIKAEIVRIESKIANLTCPILQIGGRPFLITFDMMLSMIDGKILQHLNQTPAMVTCSICGVNPSGMNDIDRILERPLTAE